MPTLLEKLTSFMEQGWAPKRALESVIILKKECLEKMQSVFAELESQGGLTLRSTVARGHKDQVEDQLVEFDRLSKLSR